MTDHLTARQAAEAFGVTKATIHNWVLAGYLKPVQVVNLTRQQLFDPDDLRAFAHERGITVRLPEKSQE